MTTTQTDPWGWIVIETKRGQYSVDTNAAWFHRDLENVFRDLVVEQGWRCYSCKELLLSPPLWLVYTKNRNAHVLCWECKLAVPHNGATWVRLEAFKPNGEMMAASDE